LDRRPCGWVALWMWSKGRGALGGLPFKSLSVDLRFDQTSSFLLFISGSCL